MKLQTIFRFFNEVFNVHFLNKDNIFLILNENPMKKLYINAMH